MNKKLLIGAHTSTAGGLENALIEGQEIGATTIQLFTSSQRQWKGRQIKPEELFVWEKTREEKGISHMMSHASYLINLASGDSEMLAKSRTAFQDEIDRCLLLKLDYLNFHPGAAKECPPEEALARIVESVNLMAPRLEGSGLTLLYEATAGQGSCLGSTLEELGYLIEGTKQKVRVGICVDTCHIFAAGYDLRTEEAQSIFFKQFDDVIGLEYLKGFHVNDSAKPLGSRVDRHASLGKGEMGLHAFELLMKNPLAHKVPLILETPDPGLWKEEIALLRQFSA